MQVSPAEVVDSLIILTFRQDLDKYSEGFVQYLDEEVMLLCVAYVL